jgi:tetratricopeptide (TPR) repeat protein
MRSCIAAVWFMALLFAGAASAAGSSADRDYRAANTLFQGQKYREALALYQKALAAPPAGVPAGDIHRRIGDAYFRINDFPRALDAYRSALADPTLADKAQCQYWIGFCCFLLGRDAEAVTELLKVPQRYPDAGAWGSTAYYWAGRASERMGRKDLSAEYYRKAGGSGRSTQGKFALQKAEAAKGK